MLTRCPRPYRDQLAVARRARCMDQASVVVLTEKSGFIWDVNSGRLVRDFRNGFDGVNVARTREVYSVGKAVRQLPQVVFPVAFRDFVFNDE